MKHHTPHTAGYSLIEALVAISILLIVITGPLTILTTTARSSSYASEQVAAFFLAQEGLELIQKMRDDLFLQHFQNPVAVNNPWVSFKSLVDPVCTTACRVVLSNTGGVTVSAISSTVPSTLLYAGATTTRARIGHTNTAAMTPTYTRRITVFDGANGVRVRSEVTWISGSIAATQRVELDTYLYNAYNIQP